MKLLIILLLVLCHGICLAQDLPGNQKKTGTLTVQQAAELVKKANGTRQPYVANELDLNRLTSIDRAVARELSHYKGYTISLDGLTSISKEVARELTLFKGSRLSLNGLTSITKDVAHELAKRKGDLNLNYVKSMDSEVVREFTKFKGSFLNIQFLESIAPEDVALLKQALKKPTFDYNYRAMMPYKLNGDKDWKKWNGKIIEFRKDGSKKKQKEYKYGGLISRMEWDEAGNLIKEETFPVYKPRGVELNEQSVKPTEVKDLKTEYSEVVLLFNKGRITSEREYPFNDLGWDKERIAYVRGEEEPFTGIAFSDRSDGTRFSERSFLNGKKHGNSLSIRRDGSIYGIEQFNHGETLRWLYWFKLDSDLQDTRYQNGKQSLKLIWDKDGNLIRKETF